VKKDLGSSWNKVHLADLLGRRSKGRGGVEGTDEKEERFFNVPV